MPADPVLLPWAAFYNEDCIAGAATHLADGSVDLIVTDPPYGIHGDRLHAHYSRDERHVIPGYVEVEPEEYAAFSCRWVREAERVLRPGGSIYIVSGYTRLYEILHALQQTELEEVNHLIWRYRFGVFTRRKYISSHCHILFYEKPGGRRTFNLESRFSLHERAPDGRSLNNADREDVWAINREYKPGRPKNKNELPLELVTKILQYSSREGDLVCDFFMGGFTVARAAIGMGRRFVGFEISQELFSIKIGEVAALKPGWLLPSLRTSEASVQENRGRRWSREELDYLAARSAALRGEGRPKAEVIRILCRELGRGRWGVERALKRMAGGRERA